MANQGREDDGSDGSVKRRAACDECRIKKLKCTGERPICSRCSREKISCLYSPQKQMGRPKKRRKSMDDEQITNDSTSEGQYAQVMPTQQHDSTISPSEDQQVWDDILTSVTRKSFASPTPDWGSSNIWQCPTQPWEMRLQSQHATSSSSVSPPAATNDPMSMQIVPELISDDSDNSPPLLNIPSESLHPFQESTPHLDLNNSKGVITAETLKRHSDTSMPPCACLSTMYLTQNSLAQMDPTLSFPYSLHPLREAMKSTHDILHCKECPKRFLTAMQNTQSLGGLLMTITERLSKILEDITTEAERAEAGGESKRFRLADLNAPGSHLHSNGLGCIAAFSVEMTPAEWRQMCKKVVRAEMYGPSDGNDCCPYLMGLLQDMERRQTAWHHSGPPPDMPKASRAVFLATKDTEAECLRMVQFSKRLLHEMDWS